MQANTITITGRALSAADLTYDRAIEEINTSTYREADAVSGMRDELKLQRNVPTVDAKMNFRGNYRTTQRSTLDVEVGNNDGSGNLIAPIVVEIRVTAPVGASQADIDDMVDRSCLFAKSAEGKLLHSPKQVI